MTKNLLKIIKSYFTKPESVNLDFKNLDVNFESVINVLGDAKEVPYVDFKGTRFYQVGAYGAYGIGFEYESASGMAEFIRGERTLIDYVATGPSFTKPSISTTDEGLWIGGQHIDTAQKAIELFFKPSSDYIIAPFYSIQAEVDAKRAI